MTRESVIETIENLAMSQGLYGRVLRYLEELQDADPYGYESIMEQLEKCSDTVDLVLTIEQ